MVLLWMLLRTLLGLLLRFNCSISKSSQIPSATSLPSLHLNLTETLIYLAVLFQEIDQVMHTIFHGLYSCDLTDFFPLFGELDTAQDTYPMWRHKLLMFIEFECFELVSVGHCPLWSVLY